MTLFRLLEEKDIEKIGISEKIGWPSIVAERDGEIIGWLITQERDDAVSAGPISANSAHTAKNLIQAYENLLKALGIIQYLFCINKKNKKWLKLVKKLGIYEPYDEGSDTVSFRRRL